MVSCCSAVAVARAGEEEAAWPQWPSSLMPGLLPALPRGSLSQGSSTRWALPPRPPTATTPAMIWRTDVAEALTQTPSCYQNGGEATAETSRPFLKESSNIAPREIKACLTCDWEPCLRDGEDGDPPPAHAAGPGGAGEKRRHGAAAALLVWREARRLWGRPRPPAGSACLRLAASQVWGLPARWQCSGFPPVLFFLSFPLCEMVFGGLVFSFLFSVCHPSRQLLISERDLESASGTKSGPTSKGILYNYSQCAVWHK